MKKITLLLIATCIFICNSYSGTPPIIFKKQKYNGLNGAGAWFMIAGGALAYGGICKAIGNGDKAPNVTDYSNADAYKKAFDKWDHKQNFCNGSFSAGIGVAGLCFVFAGADMFFAARNLKLNDATTLRLKSDKNGLGLCLNFK